MPVSINNTPLMRFLEAHHSGYFGKAQELRESVAGWLSFIPATFPHYTRHTIEHSEEIISQMSKLLFENGNYQKPVLPELSGIEAYILIAAAYLHDAGMTVSDAEKARILQSAEWREWVENGGGAIRFREISEFRASQEGRIDATTRNFLADVQLRFLIAEYVRRTHHIRGGDILSMHQNEMGRFAYGDPVLVKTIAAVCVAHGLQQNELNDPERYPERRDIRDEQVNVRLLAVLLRLGDLLDMSYDRACPLLLNAASPIPADSLAHWSQYQRIEHKMVAHDKIEFTAYCENEEEHRFLHDWCAWLVSELDQARRLMVRSARHADWMPPLAIIDQASNNTINIKPAAGARYIPAQWRFELDTKAIFDRLIYDALDTPWDFLRELLQNAADATRCRMFAGLQESEGSTPQYPTQVDERIRKMYPIRVVLSTTDVHNELSGEYEQRQILTIEDLGLGMDKDVVQRFLLQVGRSFYTTREFRDSFGFVASSRFGIGFLSVFGFSDDVTIETYKPTSLIDAEPLKLRLTGPRSYILTERGTRRKPGTSIQIVLKNSVESGLVTGLIQKWCGRLEFPVLVNDLGAQTEVLAEKGESFTSEVPNVLAEGAKILVKSFPIDSAGIEGNLFVLAHIADGEERWGISNWTYGYTQSSPHATLPKMPVSKIFFHGISTSTESDGIYYPHMREDFASRIDLRGDRFKPSISRSRNRFENTSSPYSEMNSRWNEILSNHFDTSAPSNIDTAWMYKQGLFGKIGTLEFWLNEKETTPIMQDGVKLLLAAKDISSIDTLKVVIVKKNKRKKSDLIIDEEGAYIKEVWIDYMADAHLSHVFDNRILHSVEVKDDYVVVSWKKSENVSKRKWGDNILLAEFDSAFAGGRINKTGGNVSHTSVINTLHPFGMWYKAVLQACQQELFGLEESHVSRLNSLLSTPLRLAGWEMEKLMTYLKGWYKIAGLPENLYPPLDLEKSELDLGTSH